MSFEKYRIEKVNNKNYYNKKEGTKSIKPKKVQLK